MKILIWVIAISVQAAVVALAAAAIWTIDNIALASQLGLSAGLLGLAAIAFWIVGFIITDSRYYKNLR